MLPSKVAECDDGIVGRVGPVRDVLYPVCVEKSCDGLVDFLAHCWPVAAAALLLLLLLSSIGPAWVPATGSSPAGALSLSSCVVSLSWG